MTILYFHGLDGSLSGEKRNVLEIYGTVLAPQIDYRNDPDSINSLLESYINKKIDVVIGSSMGGFAAFHVADALQVPALLFNPALAARSVFQEIPDFKNEIPILKTVVIGKKDTVVDPKRTMQFITDNFNSSTSYCIHQIPELEHRIPLSIFKQQVALFFA